MEYFFTPTDAKFLASLGLNCIRIPFNHRHFMNDRNPDVIKKEGFALLDRIINACAAEGMYTILDLHTTPGGQNQAWHCVQFSVDDLKIAMTDEYQDSGLHKALFWDYKDHQDRVVQLWVELAKYYADNTWVCRIGFCSLQPTNEGRSRVTIQ